VATRAGATISRAGRYAGATTYGYWRELATDGYEWNFRPNACSGVVPTGDGRACVFAHAPLARIGRGGVACITDVVTESSDDLAARLRAASPPLATRTWPGQPGHLRAACGPGWALVGDAGCFTDPIGAHGLTDALRDAELLARAVVGAFAGGRFVDDDRLDEALERYQTVRDRLGVPLFDVVDRIASHQWDDAEIARLLPQLSSAMVDEVEALAALEPGALL